MRNLWSVILVVFGSVPVIAWAGQPRLGINVEDHHDPFGARVTGVSSGYPGTALSRENDPLRYFLVPGQHVITAINGVPVTSAADCIRLVLSAPNDVVLTVHSLERADSRDYRTTLIGAPEDPDWYSTKLREIPSWHPGSAHPQAQNVIAAAEKNSWRPKWGYRWRTGARGDLSVAWEPGQAHPDFPVMAGADGKWTPLPGYAWKTNAPHDFRAVWRPGTRHPGNDFVIAANEVGQWHPAPGYDWASNAGNDFSVVARPNYFNDEDSQYGSGQPTFNEDAWLRQLDHDLWAQSIMINTNSRYHSGR